MLRERHHRSQPVVSWTAPPRIVFLAASAKSIASNRRCERTFVAVPSPARGASLRAQPAFGRALQNQHFSHLAGKGRTGDGAVVAGGNGGFVESASGTTLRAGQTLQAHASRPTAADFLSCRPASPAPMPASPTPIRTCRRPAVPRSGRCNSSRVHIGHPFGPGDMRHSPPRPFPQIQIARRPPGAAPVDDLYEWASVGASPWAAAAGGPDELVSCPRRS